MQLLNTTVSVRSGDPIQIYVRLYNGDLHYCEYSPLTGSQITSKKIRQGVSSTQLAVLRWKQSVDAFYVNNIGQLIHLYKDKSTGGNHVDHIIMKDALIGFNVMAFIYDTSINVFCCDKNHKLYNLLANPENGYQYVKQSIRNNGKPIHNLSGLQTYYDHFNLCFSENGKWYTACVAQSEKWKYNFEQQLHIPKLNDSCKTYMVRYDDILDIFTLDEQNFIVRIHSNKIFKWQYRYYGRISNESCRAVDGSYSIVTLKHHIDFCYIGQVKNQDCLRVYQCYIGKNSDWKWRDPFIVSQRDAMSGVSVCRKENAIDVFYINTQGYLVNCYIGQRGDWSKYKTGRHCRINSNSKQFEQKTSELSKLGLSEQGVRILHTHQIKTLEQLLSAKQEDLVDIKLSLGDRILVRKMKQKTLI